jgi:predicted HicB family RNase H-like nuclease
MPKRNRPKVSTSDVRDALGIAESIVNNETTQQPQKKKEPSQRFNIRIPNQLAERLDDAAEKTGLSKSSIMIRGLYSELNKIEKE